MPIHLHAEPGDYAEGRLLPGDSLRAPTAAIVIEDLVMLGARRLIRVGTSAGVRDIELGTPIVGLSAIAADRTAMNYTGGEPHAPAASWPLVRAR